MVSKYVKNIRLPIPKCFFATCEDSKKLHPETIGHIVSTEDDIMSKVGTALQLEKEPTVIESHRLILLENMEMEGFDVKTTEGSKFLPFLSVQAAIKELAVVHCVSWAFSEITGKQLRTVWPFLHDKHMHQYTWVQFTVLAKHTVC
jgi:hypothetical protein